MYLSPNWIKRGDTVVAVILPKLGAPRCVIAVENWVVVWLAPRRSPQTFDCHS